MPSSVINSDDGVISGTSGLKSTGGDDGVLVFQSKGTETARINTDKQIVAAAGTASLPVLTTTGDVNTGIYFPAADNIGFATGGTIRGRWTTDGLCFGTDTAAANALDDYEEGTWTPVVNAQNQTSCGYVKIGKLVTVFGDLTLSFTGGASGEISGLPFLSNATYQYGNVVPYQSVTAGPFGMLVTAGTGSFNFYNGQTSGINVSSGNRIIFTITYST